MKLLSVKDQPVWIEGNQSKGWFPSKSNLAREVLFNFEIEELENDGGFLLIYYSQDKEVYADTWHETIDKAINIAESEYEVSKDLWKRTS
jgi:hypothetical protein